MRSPLGARPARIVVAGLLCLAAAVASGGARAQAPGTTVSATPSVVVLPDQDAAAWRGLAEAWFRDAGAAAPRFLTAREALAQPPPTDATPVLVLGHAGTNPLLARWYARGLDSTDLAFPGDGGWVLRWLPDTDEVGPALVAGGASPASLAAARTAVLAAWRQTPTVTSVALSPRWQAVAGRERDWWRTLLALPTLARRQDSTWMATHVGPQMQALAEPEALTWSDWQYRMIHLYSRVAQGVHATADSAALQLHRRIIETMLAHLLPTASLAAEQTTGERWDYCWASFIYALNLARSAIAADPTLARGVARAVYCGTQSWLDHSIYTAALLGKPAYPGVLGGRHEVATIYGIWLSAGYLHASPWLSAEERQQVAQWHDRCAAYFAMGDAGPVCDDNPIGVDSLDMVATYWLDSGHSAAVDKGGAEWAARYLIGHTDNGFRTASWGYEYLGAPVSSHLAMPLRKIACLARRDDWFARSLRYHRPDRSDAVFWLPLPYGLSASPWGGMHDYLWHDAETPDWTRPLPAAERLQVLLLPPARAAAVGAGKAGPVPHSIVARAGDRPRDAHAVMMGHVGLYFTNAVAGALVHYAAGGYPWLRGSLDSALSILHNRVHVGGSHTAESRHGIQVTWQKTAPDWSGWEIREPQDNGATWLRTVILWNQGSLLAIDRVLAPPAADGAWLITWLPLGTPRHDGSTWELRQADQVLRFLTDGSHELRLEAQGETVDKRPLPAGPWLLRSQATTRGAADPGKPRLTLLAVGAATATPARLVPQAQGWRVVLPGGQAAWQVAPQEHGVTLAPIPPDAPVAGPDSPAAPSPAGQSGPTAIAPVPAAVADIAAAIGMKARRLLEAPPGAALLSEEWVTPASAPPIRVELPRAFRIHAVEIALRGNEPRTGRCRLQQAGQPAGIDMPFAAATPWRINTWKGFSDSFVLGTTAVAPATTADTVLLDLDASAAAGGKARVRVFGEPAPPVVSSPFRQVEIWPQPSAGVRVACLDQTSRLTVVDDQGKPLWARQDWGSDVIEIAATATEPPRLAVLLADQRALVIDANGADVRQFALDKLTPTSYGNVPFRALWADLNGDHADDLAVGQFCFAAAFDGRDGRLLGQSKFISLFWPQCLALTAEPAGPRLWTAPAYAAVVSVWDCAAEPPRTRYCTSAAVDPQNGGRALCLEACGAPVSRLVGVREQIAWTRACADSATESDGAGEYTRLENIAGRLWRPPNPLSAGAVDATGQVLAGDILGTLYSLDRDLQPRQTAHLPEPARWIGALAGTGVAAWWVTGVGGNGWLLDRELRPVARYDGRDTPWQPVAAVRLRDGRPWWGAVVGRTVVLFEP